MNCKTFDQRLEAYLAGELAPAERTEMEKHQVTCAHCQEATDRATRLDGLLHDGLLTAAAMKPQEQVALRESVLSRVEKTRPAFWRGWVPRLAGLVATLAAVIAMSLALLGRGSVPTVSAAEIIAHAQAAMDEHSGLNGILHWEASLEQWHPEAKEMLESDYEIWFDFDDPGRYDFRLEFSGWFQQGEIRDGVNHLWKYLYYPDHGDASFADEIILSSTEMQELASWHVPTPFRDDLARFADILPDVEVVGETDVAGRRAYLLRGQLFNISTGYPPDPITSTVTLTIDAETYWLLGWEEVVVGEARSRAVYRTECFELLSQEQATEDAFTFTPPKDIEIRQIEGMDAFEPHLPSMTLEEAAETASHVLLVPTYLPQGLTPLPYVLLKEEPSQEGSIVDLFTLMYQGSGGKYMEFTELAKPVWPTLAARLVDVGGKQGWLASDLIDSRVFRIYLQDWGEEPEGGKPRPGGVMLSVRGFSVDEAIAVLESLEPYAP